MVHILVESGQQFLLKTDKYLQLSDIQRGKLKTGIKYIDKEIPFLTGL